MEGQVWRMTTWEGTHELHLIVVDDGRELNGMPVVTILDLETGEVDYEYTAWLDSADEAYWERVL